MNIPPVVNAYFAADRGHDADALAQVFSTDAVVEDEGTLHEGVNAIRAWWLAAKEKYHPVAEPIEMTGTGNKISVRTKVTGKFPNSPATLEFLFTLESDKIVELKIHLWSRFSR
jgi:SnoaL-like domain